jgi:hypothetical protein
MFRIASINPANIADAYVCPYETFVRPLSSTITMKLVLILKRAPIGHTGWFPANCKVLSPASI